MFRLRGNGPGQWIPNPNQDRLGIPDAPRNTPGRRQPQNPAAQREAHRRALLNAREMLSDAIALREFIQSSLSKASANRARQLASQIEKRARQVRTGLD